MAERAARNVGSGQLFVGARPRARDPETIGKSLPAEPPLPRHVFETGEEETKVGRSVGREMRTLPRVDVALS